MAKLTFKRKDSDHQSDSLSTSPVYSKHYSTSDFADCSLEPTEASHSQSQDIQSIPVLADTGESAEIAPEQPLRCISEGILPSEISRSEISPTAPPKKAVSWSNIVIHHHAVVLGDNPSVSSGPPIALGPDLLHKDSLPVLEYEEGRPPRREKFQMALPRMTREDMLKGEGYGRADFRHVETEIRRVKRCRKANAAVSLWERLRHASHSKGLPSNLKRFERDRVVA